jgi:hypothetical protein
LTEDEFWASTMAKVMALHDIRVNEWDRRRDYFVAYMVSTLQACHGSKDPIDPETLLEAKYDKRPGSDVYHTYDPDEGAMWEGIPITSDTQFGGIDE